MQQGGPGGPGGQPQSGQPQGQPGGQQQNIFYQIANGEIPSKTVYENDSFRAVLDKEPATEGHTLIIPKEQVQITPQFTPEMNAALADAVKTVSEKLLRGLGADGTTVFVANGAVAGQNAPHTLIHVIPRGEADDVGLRPSPRDITDEAYEEAKTRLMQALGVQSQQAQQRPSQPSPQKSSQQAPPQSRPETQDRSPQSQDSDVDLDAVQDRFT
jgi:histidine triad (HIT) family protein